MLVAGRRFGKTVLALTWLVTEVLRRPPGALGYYVAPYRVMARAIAWDLLLRATRDLRTGRHESELAITLPGGRKIALKGADDPETLEGVGLVAVVLDEFGRMKLAAWEKSLRPALADQQGRALLCGKPRGCNHLQAFYRRGQDPAQPAWWSALYTTAEGGHVPAADLAEARATLPPRIYRQEFESSFEAAAGRVYDPFVRRTHVVPHDELARRYEARGRWRFRRLVAGIDWGYTDPGAVVVVGQTATGHLVALAEEYRAGVLVDAAGWLGIFRRLAQTYGIERYVADPSQPGYLTAARQFLAGQPVVEAAQNDRIEGVRRVSVALLPRAPEGTPGLVISDACPHLLRELEGYVFREVRGVATEDPADGDDHACDALRYAVMALTR